MHPNFVTLGQLRCLIRLQTNPVMAAMPTIPTYGQKKIPSLMATSALALRHGDRRQRRRAAAGVALMMDSSDWRVKLR